MQTSGYTTNQALGVEGQLADLGVREVMSLLNAETTAVTYGVGVVDKKDGTFEEFDAAYKDIAGANLLEHAEDNADETAASTPAKEMASILRKGKIIVSVETAVTAGAEAFCRFANGVLDNTQTTKGKWGADDDTNTRRHVKGAKFRSAAAKDGLAVLELSDELGGYDLVSRDAAVSALSATTTINLGAVPSGRVVRLRTAQLSAGVTAGNGTDKWTCELLAGAVVLATWNSDVAVNGAITQGTPEDLVKVANAVGAPGAALTFVATKAASGATWSAGHLTVDLEVL